jgi:hypothetical protein
VPSKAIYLDDETYKRTEEICQLKGMPMGAVLADWVRMEAGKFKSDEERPKRCKTDHEFLPISGTKCEYCDLEAVIRIANQYRCKEHTLEWHLIGEDSAQLYCICVKCLWRYLTNEFYRTHIWSP